MCRVWANRKTILYIKFIAENYQGFPTTVKILSNYQHSFVSQVTEAHNSEIKERSPLISLLTCLSLLQKLCIQQPAVIPIPQHMHFRKGRLHALSFLSTIWIINFCFQARTQRKDWGRKEQLQELPISQLPGRKPTGRQVCMDYCQICYLLAGLKA